MTFKKWNTIRDLLTQAYVGEESNFRMNCSLQFDEKVKEFEKMLCHVKLTTKYLQTRCLKLSDGRAHLDMLISGNAHNHNHPTCQCDLNTFFVGPNSKKCLH